MDVVERIDRLAKAKGWSRSEVFRRVGLNPVAAADWRKGKSTPDKHIAKFAEVLNTSESYLRGETDDPAPTINYEDDLEYIGHRARNLPPEQQAAFKAAMKAFLDALDEHNKK